MSGLTTRDALAEHEPVLGVFDKRAGIVGCTCLSARDYRAAGYRSGQNGWREHLLASGAVVDAATLADDDELAGVLMRRWGCADSDQDAYDSACADLRALGAALSERAKLRDVDERSKP